jgi:hypothetical protein
MKYTLSTDDKEEHLVWLNGPKYLGVIEDLRNWIRSELKYNPKLKPLEAKVLESVRSKIFEIEKELTE